MQFTAVEERLEYPSYYYPQQTQMAEVEALTLVDLPPEVHVEIPKSIAPRKQEYRRVR